MLWVLGNRDGREVVNVESVWVLEGVSQFSEEIMKLLKFLTSVDSSNVLSLSG
jgi:hypothetical protein